MDSRSCAQPGAKQAMGELGDLYYLGRLGRLVRSCRTAAKGQVAAGRSRHRTQLCEYPIQLRDASRMPGDQPLFEAGHFQGISFACKPGEILRSDIRTQTIEWEGQRFRRYVRLL